MDFLLFIQKRKLDRRGWVVIRCDVLNEVEEAGQCQDWDQIKNLVRIMGDQVFQWFGPDLQMHTGEGRQIYVEGYFDYVEVYIKKLLTISTYLT